MMGNFVSRLIVLLIAVSHSAAVFAQNDTESDSRLALARAVVSLQNTEEMYETALQTTLPLVRIGFQNVPGATTEKLDQVEIVFLGIMMTTYPGVIDGAAAIYADRFNLEELQGLLAFYQSPVGARLLDELPNITIESAALGTQLGEQAVQDNLALLTAVFE